MDIVVIPADIELSEDARSVKAVNDIIGKEQRVPILYCIAIKLSIILY